jgi:hypothetical protein
MGFVTSVVEILGMFTPSCHPFGRSTLGQSTSPSGADQRSVKARAGGQVRGVAAHSPSRRHVDLSWTWTFDGALLAGGTPAGEGGSGAQGGWIVPNAVFSHRPCAAARQAHDLCRARGQGSGGVCPGFNAPACMIGCSGDCVWSHPSFVLHGAIDLPCASLLACPCPSSPTPRPQCMKRASRASAAVSLSAGTPGCLSRAASTAMTVSNLSQGQGRHRWPSGASWANTLNGS